jgi:hypothetical protein
MQRPEITRHLRRLACLDLALNAEGQLTATKRWLHRAK